MCVSEKLGIHKLASVREREREKEKKREREREREKEREGGEREYGEDIKKGNREEEEVKR